GCGTTAGGSGPPRGHEAAPDAKCHQAGASRAAMPGIVPASHRTNRKTMSMGENREVRLTGWQPARTLCLHDFDIKCVSPIADHSLSRTITIYYHSNIPILFRTTLDCPNLCGGRWGMAVGLIQSRSASP